MSKAQIRYTTVFIICICLSSFMAGVDLLIMSVAIDPMRKALHANIVTAQWFLTAFAIGCAACYIGIGRISDRVGKRRTFNAGAILFGLSSLLVALSANAWLAIVFRFVQGASIAMVINSATSLVMEYFSIDQRPKRIANLITAGGLGFSLGPITGGILLHYFSWRALFLINIPFALFAVICAHFSIPKHGHTHDEPIHISNLVLLSLSIIALSTFISQGNEWGWISVYTWLSLLGFILLLFAFIYSERHSTTPLINHQLFSMKNFIAGCSAGLILYIPLIGLLLVLGLYFQDAYGLNHLQTGLAFLPYALGFVVGPPIIARLMKKMAHKSMCLYGYIIMILTLPLLTVISPQTPYSYLIVPLFVFSLGLNAVNTSTLPIALQFTPPHSQGIASGIGMMTRWLGGALGAALLAAVFSANLQTSPTHALHICLWLLTLVSAVGALLTVFFIQTPVEKGN